MSTVAEDKTAQDERKLEAGGVATPVPASSGLHPALFIAYAVNVDSTFEKCDC